MKFKIAVLLAFLSFALTNCSMPTDVKETKDNSNRLAGDSSYIAQRTGDIFAGARKDLGFERPDERFKELVKAKGDSEKIRYATAMCSSYEFQQWLGNYTDTLAVKNRLYAKATRDLFAMVESLINHNYSVQTSLSVGPVTLPVPPDNRWKSLASIAVALGEIDEDQIIASTANHTAAESLYSLIVKGLNFKEQANRGEAIPDYARNVLDYEDEAIYLLQLRHNYFVAMVMSRFSNFATSDFKEIRTFADSLSTNDGLRPKVPDNLTKIQDQGILWLELAEQTQRDLVHLKVPLKFNAAIKRIFEHAEFVIPVSVEATPALQRGIGTLNRKFAELQETFRTGKPAPDDGYLESVPPAPGH